ncbi:hypothetical protein Pfo_016432 [Paulownia fortunei]|nr:hypothetical protein Pfo_016432 [Paulownia fortunei]
MLQRLSVSHVLYKTHRFLRNVSSPPFTNFHQLAPHAVTFSWFNECRKMHACPNRTLLINPYSLCGRISNSAVEHSVLSSSSLLGEILRRFCTLEALESEKTSDNGGINYVDKVHKTLLDYSNPEYKMEVALDKLGIELTTPLVVEVLHRLHFEEKLAFRFFNWAGHQQHYSHKPESYNKMIDILSRSNKNSIPIEVLLTILRQYTKKHLTHLQKFAKKKIRVKTQPEINAFNLLLDAIKSKVKPNADTYNILFFLGGAGSETQLEAQLSSPTAKTYVIMMLALVQNDRMDEYFKILADVIDSGCLPDVSTYKKLIDGMCLSGKIEAAFKFFEEMGRTGYPSDIVTYNCFLKVLVIIRIMNRRGCARDTDTYCVMIEGLFGCSNTRDAIFLLEQVINRGMKLPYKKFDTFLLQLSAIGDLQSIHRLSEHMSKFYNRAMARRFALNQKRKSMSLRDK